MFSIQKECCYNLLLFFLLANVLFNTFRSCKSLQLVVYLQHCLCALQTAPISSIVILVRRTTIATVNQVSQDLIVTLTLTSVAQVHVLMGSVLMVLTDMAVSATKDIGEKTAKRRLKGNPKEVA